MNTDDMEFTSCVQCGIAFGVPACWLNARRADKVGFFCPNGHGLSYHKSTIDKLREEKDAAERRLQAQLNEANHARLVAQKELESERRKRRKIEKRIAGGVCPCCNRSFEDLYRHMQTKHKDFALPPANPPALPPASV